ncbi:flagellar basal body P-ring formation protein FlgA [Rheinheimera sp. YQF-2]|uniref:Flagella basal body P-ring formation protein FlgA n=1 Tax=Rheinheimera lutimaris TaxID=2740584 RepID=A0A7Y5APV9_9GAMM|nr:flagellar basal body P-ring formation chaperone FlgA [Rheinheimera lutimaris]NRQ42342.1 flagellar basal body P-ring formation protein FlgA [Rheinheimera lutimaris]
MKKYENLFKQTLTVTVAALCFSNTVRAADPQSYTPGQLTELAATWLEQQVEERLGELQINITPLDNRIGDKHCSNPLQLSLSQDITQRQNTIQLRCNTEQSWLLYVPVRIDEIVRTVVMTQNITTGTLISADMLTTDSRERRFVRGSLVSDESLIIGAKSKKSLSLGQIITLQDLCLVCKGDVVTISVSDNGLQVAATGIAQNDGSLGDTISVLNRQSKRAIIAEVTAVNRVSVKF